MTEHDSLPTAEEFEPERRRRFGARAVVSTVAALLLVGVLVAVKRDEIAVSSSGCSGGDVQSATKRATVTAAT